jgi:hypothetical protein
MWKRQVRWSRSLQLVGGAAGHGAGAGVGDEAQGVQPGVGSALLRRQNKQKKHLHRGGGVSGVAAEAAGGAQWHVLLQHQGCLKSALQWAN